MSYKGFEIRGLTGIFPENKSALETIFGYYSQKPPPDENIDDIEKAAKLARDRAAKEGFTVLAIGGLFLAVEVQHAWRGGDPTSLEFL